MIRGCSWNVRGLNDPFKRVVVRDVLSKIRNVVVCLQESKVCQISRSFLRSFGGSFLDKCVFVESKGASGGVITCWSSRIFVCHEVIVRQFSIIVFLTRVNSGTSFYVTNVYRPATWDGKEEFYLELK